MNPWIGLDIGGANLKAADGLAWTRSLPFPLWKEPDRLASALAELLADAPPAAGLAVTMTGELCDCFTSKAEGVRRIVQAALTVADARPIRFHQIGGAFVTAAEAIDRPAATAASNWHALTSFAGRFAPDGPALLIDAGSTTVDIIPLVDGLPAALGATDPERLASGELVYTGVRRSPVCALVPHFVWKERLVPTAQELFATAGDAYLLLGRLPEEPERTDTADGRPFTRDHARSRLARMICADRSEFDEHDALRAALIVEKVQLARVEQSARGVMLRLPGQPRTILVSGEGEFLAREAGVRLRTTAEIVSLAERLGAEISQVAPAYALAVLARERLA